MTAARNPYDGGNKPCASSEPHEPHTWTLAAIDGNYYDCPGVPEPPAAWVHEADLIEKVTAFVRPLIRSYPRAEPVTVTVRRAEREDGCWCLREKQRPHAHKPGLGACPPEPAGDSYVLVIVS